MLFVVVLIFALLTSAERFIPANDPSIWTVGRTQSNADGTLSFDWESTQFFINVNQAEYMKMHLKAVGQIVGLFIIQVDGWEQSQVCTNCDEIKTY